MMLSSWFLSGLVLLSSLSLVSATWSDHFAEFFPGYSRGFQILLNKECADNYTRYLEDRENNTRVDLSLKVFGSYTTAHDVVQCLLEATPELIKAKMASAQVVLGLTPSILATLGASPQETAMLSIIARRQLLAGFLAAGSPAVFALRSFEYARTIEDLHERNFSKPAFFIRLEPIIVVLEYLVAAASIGNITELCYRLGGHVLTATFTGDEYTFFLWAFLGFVIHGLGALALYLRTKVTTLRRDYEGGHIYRHRVNAVFNQFKPMAQQTRLRVVILEESLLFFAIYWFTNALTVCHIIYGTILFSGVLFISVNDAVVVIARLMASVMMCRAVLTYELANLRRVVERIERNTIVEDTDAAANNGEVEMQRL